MTMAISRHQDRRTVSAKLDDFGTDGEFLYDGTVIRGKLGSISPEDLAFKIWFQMQNIKWSEKKGRQEWRKVKDDWMAGKGWNEV